MTEHNFATELWDIDALMPNDANPQQGDVGAIATAIAKDGWHGQVSCQAPNGRRKRPRIFAGEHRWRALKMLQKQGIYIEEEQLTYSDLLEREILLPPVGKVPVQLLSLEDYRALRKLISDNRMSDLASYDDQQLAAILRDIADEDGLVGTGFDDEALDELLRDLAADEAKNRPRASDEAPERPENPVTKLGDLIVLGEHRLLCGDSRDPDSFARLLGDERADMVWTDPPYGVSYVGKTKDALTIDNDEEADIQPLLAEVFAATLKSTRPGAAWFVSAPAGPIQQVFDRELLRIGVRRQILIWLKDRFVLGHSDYHYRHEPVFYGWTPGAAHTEPPDRTQDSVWEIPRPSSSEQHPTMKPVELVARALRNHSGGGDLVLDPFSGSGTTLMACEQEGRAARVIELDPGYCDVIVARWEKHTGQKAQRP